MTEPSQPEHGIQATPPGLSIPENAISPASDVIPLPPLPPAPELPALAIGWPAFDRFLGLMVAVLAVFLGSFAAGNTDFWQHLATGRAIAQGNYQFGVDPFSFATSQEGTQVYWVNHSWLYDLLLYLLYSQFGQISVVVLQAAFMVVLLIVFIRFRPRDSSPIAVLVIATLTLLVVSQRVLLNSMMASYVLMALTLLLMRRGGVLGALPAQEESAPKAVWMLPLVFVLWVNLDAWFILGLLSVGAVVLGNALAHVLGWKGVVSLPTQAMVLLACVAACVINPHYVNAFTLPPSLAYVLGGWLPPFLGAGGDSLRILYRLDSDLLTGYGLIAPLHPNLLPFTGARGNQTIANAAYFVLVFLGVLGAALILLNATRQDGPGLPLGRLLALGLVTVLSLLQIRMIPLFAVVAGPITLLNLADFARWWQRNPSGVEARGFNPNLARFAVFMLLFIGLGLAWPGWLHSRIGTASAPRRVAWQVLEDPSLRAAAEALEKVQAKNVFNYTFDIANYCAWFAPQTRCYVDQRFELFAHAVTDYAKARREFMQDANEILQDANERLEQQRKPARGEWVEFFKRHQIDHLVITRFRDLQTTPIGLVCWLQPWHWTQRFGDGRTHVFAWSAAGQAPESLFVENWKREAFGVVPSEQRIPAGGVAPPDGGPSLKALYLESQPAFASRDATEPFAHFMYFDLVQSRWPIAYDQVWKIAGWSEPAGFAGAVPGTVLAMALEQKAHLLSLSNIAKRVRPRDAGPPAPPLLMIRHLRRALHDNPFDARSYLSLFQAYNLQTYLMEDGWARTSGVLTDDTDRMFLRKIQLMTALRNYLELEPDKWSLRLEMAKLLYRHHHLDAGLEQLALAQKSLEKERLEARDKRSRDELKAQEKNVVEFYKATERDIKRRRGDLELKSSKLEPMQKYELAVLYPYKTIDKDNKDVMDSRGMGLTLEGLKHLQSIPPDSLKENQKLELHFSRFRLLMMLGRVGEATADLLPLLKEERLAHQCLLWHAAALGDYENMDKELAAIETLSERNFPVAQAYQAVTRSVAMMQWLHLGNEQPTMARLASIFPPSLVLVQMADGYHRTAGAVASRRTLRGLFALEAGDVIEAEVHFAEALRLVGRHTMFPDRPIAERYLELIRAEKR